MKPHRASVRRGPEEPARESAGRDPDRTLLPDVLAARLADRAQALLPLGALTEDAHAADPAERAALDELTERLRATYPYPERATPGRCSSRRPRSRGRRTRRRCS